MFDRRLISNFSWPFFSILMAMSAVGLLNLYSASSGFESSGEANYFKHQFIWSGICLGILIVSLTIHYRRFYMMSYVIYGLTVFLLVLVLIVGKKVAGHQSWLVFGPITLQPTETGKIGLIFGLSKYLSNWNGGKKASIKELWPSMIILIIPMALVLMQGDLGSSLFYVLIYGTIIILQGIQTKIIAVISIVSIAICILAYLFFLSPYQKNRILNFLNPENDRRGSGYHLFQSKIAVGSGGLVGKGFMKGDNHKLKFIPERHTDFIFAVLAEEWGFFGGFFLLFLYTLFIYFCLDTAAKTTDRFSFFICIGSTCLFFWHMVINLGGMLGLMPLTGVPLPFMSYGGSALLNNWIMAGVVININMRRFMFS